MANAVRGDDRDVVEYDLPDTQDGAFDVVGASLGRAVVLTGLALSLDLIARTCRILSRDTHRVAPRADGEDADVELRQHPTRLLRR